MKKLLIIAAFMLAAYAFFEHNPDILNLFNSPQVQQPSSDNSIAQAFQNRQSNLQVQGSGTVIAILPDDNEGSRHQRFIVKLSSGQTLLIAHNIDLAPRISALSKGDTIDFHGEYEWNEKGGVIHWTHHDPNRRHANGWIIHQGRKYG